MADLDQQKCTRLEFYIYGNKNEADLGVKENTNGE